MKRIQEGGRKYVSVKSDIITEKDPPQQVNMGQTASVS